MYMGCPANKHGLSRKHRFNRKLAKVLAAQDQTASVFQLLEAKTWIMRTRRCPCSCTVPSVALHAAPTTRFKRECGAYFRTRIIPSSARLQNYLGLRFLDAQKGGVVGVGLLRAVAVPAGLSCISARSALARYKHVLRSRVRGGEKVQRGPGDHEAVGAQHGLNVLQQISVLWKGIHRCPREAGTR